MGNNNNLLCECSEKVNMDSNKNKAESSRVYDHERLDGATRRTEHIHKGQHYQSLPILFGRQGDNQSPLFPWGPYG